MTLRVLLADDHSLVIDALTDRLAGEDGIDIVATAVDGRDLVQQYRQHHPDVVLCDNNMPNMTGTQATRVIVDEDPDARVVILSAESTHDQVVAAVRAGAVGYVLKSASSAALATVLRSAAKGEATFGDRLLPAVLEPCEGQDHNNCWQRR